jgi:hypothetical protein
MIDTPGIGLVIPIISGIPLNASMEIPTNHSDKHRTKMLRLVTLILDLLRVSPPLLMPLVKVAHANLEGESRVWGGWKLPRL